MTPEGPQHLVTTAHTDRELAQDLHRFQPDNVLALTRGDSHKFSSFGKGLLTVYLLGKKNQLVWEALWYVCRSHWLVNKEAVSAGGLAEQARRGKLN